MVRADTSLRPSGRHQRKLRNYLLDPKFQLKYANFLAIVALVIGGSSGVLLWRASDEAIAQSQASVALGKEVLQESEKVSQVVAMNIVKDPVYSENPALKAAFEADAKRQADKYAQQNSQLRAQAEQLEKMRQRVLVILFSVLAVLVMGLWLAGVMVTHRIAGPIFKMRRQLRRLEKGDFQIPSPLRRGDELKEFFDGFNDMVKSLRARRQSEVDTLHSAIEGLRDSVPEEQLKPLLELKEQLEQTLLVEE